jgi:glycerate kinase
MELNKIVLAIDSFKGCLTSTEIEATAAAAIKTVFPACEVIQLPIADGGEGLLEVLITVTSGKSISVDAHGPLMENRNTRYGISGDGKTGLIEMAAVNGLPLVPVERRNPMLTTSFGTGELIKDALDRGCRDFIIGIGGSATNDAGLGMLQALGFSFLNRQNKEVGVGGKVMSEVVAVNTDNVHPALKDSRFTIACDVNNPFYGRQGAAHIYAPQKGADSRMVEELDKGLQSLANVIRQTTGKEMNVPGAGAAGGLGGGFLAFLNATLK